MSSDISIDKGFISRLDWYFKMVDTASIRSSCERKKVGAIIVDPKTYRIMSIGYNGSPPGAPHCTDGGCLVHNNHCINTLHAELNALANLQVKSEGLIMLVTTEPCLNCTKIMMAFKLGGCIYLEAYDNEEKRIFSQHLLNNNSELFPTFHVQELI